MKLNNKTDYRSDVLELMIARVMEIVEDDFSSIPEVEVKYARPRKKIIYATGMYRHEDSKIIIRLNEDPYLYEPGNPDFKFAFDEIFVITLCHEIYHHYELINGLNKERGYFSHSEANDWGEEIWKEYNKRYGYDNQSALLAME